MITWANAGSSMSGIYSCSLLCGVLTGDRCMTGKMHFELPYRWYHFMLFNMLFLLNCGSMVLEATMLILRQSKKGNRLGIFPNC